MASNKGIEISIKNNTGKYIPLYPKTTKDQVINWNIGEVTKCFEVSLDVTRWVNNVQNIFFTGVSAKDIIYCVKKLSGTLEECKRQNEDYALLTSVESMSNNIQFICKEKPKNNITVQLWWTK